MQRKPVWLAISVSKRNLVKNEVEVAMLVLYYLENFLIKLFNIY